MPSVCLLSTEVGSPVTNDNPERLARGFIRAGWQVTCADHDDLRNHKGVLGLAQSAEPLEAFDLIWPIGLGRRQTFLDRMQLLSHLDSSRFVNTPTALLTLHAKHALPLDELRDLHPETHASNDAGWLRRVIEGGGEWMIKPSAGSYGRGIHRVSADSEDLDQLLVEATGGGDGDGDGADYCMVQRFHAEIEAGETRVLVANGEIVACYRRIPVSDHRANLDVGGHPRPHQLTGAEMEIAERTASHLASRGVRFVAIDIAPPYVVEYNIANPGGLATVERLTGTDPTAAVITALGKGF